jgi:guanosine-3',5'-bis(diphosphate) 3'-pyrophosphohydrolase
MKPDIFHELLETIQFAAYKHRNQRRKDRNGTPYIHHPIEVCRVLWKTGSISDPDILKAALLHDVLEDTRTHPDEIKDRFGNDVLSFVQEVTYEKSKPRKVRKKEQVMTASEKSPGAKQIELADKICNIKDTLDNPPWFWNEKRKMAYIEWAAEVIEGLRGVNPDLEELFDQLVAKGREKYKS